jgi:flagellar biosynthesis protein
MKSGNALQNAIALSYSAEDFAPHVVAKGKGLVAEEIIRRARDAGVYVHQSTELVSMLMGVDLDQHIPPQLYVVVAELLAWLHGTEQSKLNLPTTQPRT